VDVHPLAIKQFRDQFTRRLAVTADVEVEAAADKEPFGEASVPLFMRDGLESKNGNAQDEKDETEE
jgi:hypothetical protein